MNTGLVFAGPVCGLFMIMKDSAPEVARPVQAPEAAQEATKPASSRAIRPTVRGKFVFVGDEKLYLRGVTYGTFRPDAHGDEFPDASAVRNDFRQMAENHITVLRVYTRPPRWLLDEAERHGLRVMVGLPVE